jgi:hypothetical protein
LLGALKSDELHEDSPFEEHRDQCHLRLTKKAPRGTPCVLFARSEQVVLVGNRLITESPWQCAGSFRRSAGPRTAGGSWRSRVQLRSGNGVGHHHFVQGSALGDALDGGARKMGCVQ